MVESSSTTNKVPEYNCNEHFGGRTLDLQLFVAFPVPERERERERAREREREREKRERERERESTLFFFNIYF